MIATNKVKLSEISTLISKGSTPRGKVNYSKTEKNDFLRVTDMADYGRVKKSDLTLSDEDFAKNKMRLWPVDTVLISIEGTIGKVSILKKVMAFNQAVAGVVVDKTKILPEYLMYYLKSESAFGRIVKGTIMPAIRLGDISNLDIDLPSLNNQKKIVDTLEKIDSKIGCNNRTNDNLDKLLKLKFNDWVDNLSNARLSNLAEIATYRNGLAMQKYRPKNGNGLPVIKIKEMNSGFSKETERCDETIDEDYIVHDGDVLFAWSGTLCAMIWSSGDGGLNQHIFKVTSEKYPKWFYYLWTLRHLDKFIQIAAGKATTMGHIKRKELSLSEVLVPEDNEIKNMDKIMTPILDKIIENNIENRRLTKLRDTLLPELLNGKIDISNIDI